MKTIKLILTALLIILSQLIFSQANVGIGIAVPQAALHIFKGSAGIIPFPNAMLATENAGNNFINLLAPAANETGVLFGSNLSNAEGGIIYNTPLVNRGLQFNTSGAPRIGISSTGNLDFLSDQSSITFAIPGANPKPMMYMFPSGTANTNRMIISHSPAFQGYGLQYNDFNDQFDFLSNGSSVLRIDLGNSNVAVNGNLNVANGVNISGTSAFAGNVNVSDGFVLRVGTTTGAKITIGSFESFSDGGPETIISNSDIVPSFDINNKIGSSSKRWSSIFSLDGVINTSDAREKTNIKDLDYGLKDIMKLHSVKFNWLNRSSDGSKIGLIAQELQKVIPEVVRDWEYIKDEATGAETKVATARLGVTYSDLIPVLIKGMQEQQQIIQKLQSDIIDLKNRN